MGKRIAQLNSLVQQEVAGILLRELDLAEVMVTVTKAAVADDAESAKVWVSVLPADAGPTVLDHINRKIGDIQSALNKRLVMKFVPRLTFQLDESGQKAERINQVLDELTSEEVSPPQSET